MVTNVTLSMVTAIRSLLARTRDEDGQTLAEYGLIMAIIAVFVVGGSAVLLRGAIETTFTDASNCLDGAC